STLASPARGKIARLVGSYGLVRSISCSGAAASRPKNVVVVPSLAVVSGLAVTSILIFPSIFLPLFSCVLLYSAHSPTFPFLRWIVLGCGHNGWRFLLDPLLEFGGRLLGLIDVAGSIGTRLLLRSRERNLTPPLLVVGRPTALEQTGHPG